ncbi:MAG: DUF1854 domain-containing protein [Eubacteriales bacterium]|nr:DUF1854 domain-containing protein [Eubacteriales bacterium]
MADNKKSLSDIVDIIYLNAENAVFEPKNDFLTLKIKLPVTVSETGQISEEVTEEQTGEDKTEKQYDRVFLHRAFPFEEKLSYISVSDKDANEIALIKNIDDIHEDQRKYIIDELDRKYYSPEIKKILSMKERFGFSYWKVLTDTGEHTFTIQDTYRNIHKISMTHVFLTDVDGNRYDIPDLEALDHKSYKKIELYM